MLTHVNKLATEEIEEELNHKQNVQKVD